MRFPHLTNKLFPGRVIILLIMFTGWTDCLAQDKAQDASKAHLRIYEAAQESLKHDPLIQNGVYYSYPYYNATGHPFLDQKEFDTGSVDFRGKHYGGLSINYDLFNQLIILSWESEGILQMSLLAPEFVSGFRLKGKHFIKIKGPDQDRAPVFYQLVSETPGVSCYYSWYKERREVRDSGNRSIFSFSDQKSRRYLRLDGQLSRYKSNKSFIKLFPEASRNLLKDYLHENRLQVMESSDQAMEDLIEYCNGILEELANGGQV
jgi:hypothetical protein